MTKKLASTWRNTMAARMPFFMAVGSKRIALRRADVSGYSAR